MCALRGENPHQVLERTFRSDSARMIAALVRRFGVNELPSIENAVQEAGVRALERWGAHIPGFHAWWYFGFKVEAPGVELG